MDVLEDRDEGTIDCEDLEEAPGRWKELVGSVQMGGQADGARDLVGDPRPILFPGQSLRQ